MSCREKRERRRHRPEVSYLDGELSPGGGAGRGRDETTSVARYLC